MAQVNVEDFERTEKQAEPVEHYGTRNLDFSRIYQESSGSDAYTLASSRAIQSAAEAALTGSGKILPDLIIDGLQKPDHRVNEITQTLSDDMLISQIKKACTVVNEAISQLPEKLQMKYASLQPNEDGTYSQDQLAFIKGHCGKDIYSVAQDHDRALHTYLDRMSQKADKLCPVTGGSSSISHISESGDRPNDIPMADRESIRNGERIIKHDTRYSDREDLHNGSNSSQPHGLQNVPHGETSHDVPHGEISHDVPDRESLHELLNAKLSDKCWYENTIPDELRNERNRETLHNEPDSVQPVHLDELHNGVADALWEETLRSHINTTH